LKENSFVKLALQTLDSHSKLF